MVNRVNAITQLPSYSVTKFPTGAPAGAAAEPAPGTLLRVRAAERDALLELHRDRFGNQLGVELGLLDLLDVDEDLAVGPLLQLLLQLVDLRALPADDDARPAGVDVDLQPVGGARRLELADAGMREALLERLLQRDVLV